jgi:uncharacterized protein YegP (UPF0339 family)
MALQLSFVIENDQPDTWRWKLRDNEARIYASSFCFFTSKELCIEGINQFRLLAPHAAIIDLTKHD